MLQAMNMVLSTYYPFLNEFVDTDIDKKDYFLKLIYVNHKPIIDGMKLIWNLIALIIGLTLKTYN